MTDRTTDAPAPDAPAPASPGEVVLGLDAGAARTGLAIGRVGSRMAFGRGTVPGGDDERVLAALRRLVQAEGVQRLVVGLPLRTDGQDSAQTTRVRRFGARLHELGLPVEFVDERFTSQAARRALRGSGLPRGKRQQKSRVDEASAILIVETYLARQRGAVDANDASSTDARAKDAPSDAPGDTPSEGTEPTP